MLLIWTDCDKVGYPDEKSARRALRSCRCSHRTIHKPTGWRGRTSRRNPKRKELRTYRCPYCKKWHLTADVFEP